jgi:hypothetical protein
MKGITFKYSVEEVLAHMFIDDIHKDLLKNLPGNLTIVRILTEGLPYALNVLGI